MPKPIVTPEQYYAQLARVRQGAGALITTPDGRVLMYDVIYRDYLELPGGAVETGETPPDACARECREELGIDIAVGRLLVLDHQTDGGDRGDSVMFVYDGGVVRRNCLSVRAGWRGGSRRHPRGAGRARRGHNPAAGQPDSRRVVSPRARMCR